MWLAAGKFSSNNSTLYKFKSSNVEPTYNKKNISVSVQICIICEYNIIMYYMCV